MTVVDLKAEQANATISNIYANVASGVKEDYIVKASGGVDSSGDKGKNNTGNNPKDNKLDDKLGESDKPQASMGKKQAKHRSLQQSRQQTLLSL